MLIHRQVADKSLKSYAGFIRLYWHARDLLIVSLDRLAMRSSSPGKTRLNLGWHRSACELGLIMDVIEPQRSVCESSTKANSKAVLIASCGVAYLSPICFAALPFCPRPAAQPGPKFSAAKI